jgi:integrase
VTTPNGRIRPEYALVGGKAVRCPEGVYHLRYTVSEKRVWEPVGKDASLAQVALMRKALEIETGTQLPEDKAVERQAATIDAATGIGPQITRTSAIAMASISVPAAVPSTPRRRLIECIASYIAETKEHKAKRTLAAYSETCFLLLESLDQLRNRPITIMDPELGRERDAKLADILGNPGVLSGAIQQTSIEDITRDDVLHFITFLRSRGNEPRTISNRVKNVRTLLYHFGLQWVLKRDDMPRYTKKKVRPYHKHELGPMFDLATPDEADALHFLLGTGAREQEMQYAIWSDLDLNMKQYTVTEHRDLGFIPKDGEEGVIPMPDVLVERLIARRKRYPKRRLIFPTAEGKPNGHALRMIKALALRAGVNCGQCFNKKGLSCADHPVCRRIILHRLRKTYATWLHKSGVPARTIMGYLRHSDLATTLLYLADGEDDEQTRFQINAAFGHFGKIGVAG